MKRRAAVRGAPEQVHLVTRARPSRYDDIATRQRRYLIRMAIRTACVAVAVFAPLPLWARAVAIAGALVLPWVSVTAANAGPLPNRVMEEAPARELAGAPDVDPGAGGDDEVR